MAETDLSAWLPVADAAAELGCSKRTIERLARVHKLEQRIRPQAGSPGVAVYSPESVAEEAQRRRRAPAPFVVAGLPAGNGNGRLVSRVSDVARVSADSALTVAGDDPIRQFFVTLIRAIQSPPSPPVAESVAESSSNPFLTLAEASASRRVSESLIRRWMRSGKLPFEREPRSRRTAEDPGYRIRRRDVEQL